jgi:undecaprenyl-phosphate glucose phosphotransferase
MSSTASQSSTTGSEVTKSVPVQKKRLSRRVAVDIVGFADLTAVFCGGILPGIIYRNAGNIVTDWALLTQTSLAAAIIVYLCLKNWNMYDPRRVNDFPIGPGYLLAAVTFAFIGMIGVGLPNALKDGHVWIWFSVALTGSYSALLLVRSLAHPILQRLTAAGRFDERVAVFGAGPIARRVHDHLTQEETEISFCGVFDDRAGTDRINPEGLHIDGKLNDLIAKCRQGSVDKIVIALPQSADNRIAHLAAKLEKLPVSIHVVTHLASDLIQEGPAHKVSNIGSVGMLDIKDRPLTDWSPVIKRAEDIVLGSVLFMVALPLMAFIALLIKLDSRGPALFKQSRIGKNQRIFDMYKFRTMSVLENGSDVQQVRKSDERVTRFGKFLRRWSLDELPQLWNVLKGDMSLVGPRPHAVAHDEQFEEIVATYALRHQVNPGITGLAQVQGLRGHLDPMSKVASRVDADIAYIKNWSLWLDTKILFQTGWAVLRGHNAH